MIMKPKIFQSFILVNPPYGVLFLALTKHYLDWNGIPNFMIFSLSFSIIPEQKNLNGMRFTSQQSIHDSRT